MLPRLLSSFVSVGCWRERRSHSALGLAQPLSQCTMSAVTLVSLAGFIVCAQDYHVHLKHLDGSNEKVPYFCLPANELNDVIAPSCYSCFDYPNALADLVRTPNPDLENPRPPLRGRN